MSISWLSWIAFMPLFLALRHLSFKNSFKIGLLTGCVHFGTLTYWLVYTMGTYGHLPLYVSIPLLFLLSIYLGLYPAIFSAAVSLFFASPFIFMAFSPIVWVSMEYVRSLLFTGFPWGFLGYSQVDHLHLIQIADLSGVYGISYLIVQTNGILFLLYGYLKGLHFKRAGISKQMAAGSILSLVCLFTLVFTYGHFRIGSMDRTMAGRPVKTVSIIQGNIDQGIKWDPKFQSATTRKYMALSGRVKPERPDLVVWPETATPFYFGYTAPLTQWVRNTIRELGTDFLIGTPSFIRKGDHTEYFNSAVLIDKTGAITGKYDKVHLVPFGEYVPLKKWLPFVNKIVADIGDFSVGNKGKILPWGDNPIGILICYEIIFPELSRAMVRNHASFLVNITNDAWYGESGAPYQHFDMAVFRAVENRRILVRSANTGISGFIDPVGRVISSSDLFTDAVLTESIPMMDEMTVYTRYGDFFALGCIVLMGLYMVIAKKPPLG
jgi:apolipoprotein N-acyltransferase